MSQTYAYIRRSPKNKDLERQIEAISHSYPDVNWLEDTQIRGYVPFTQRPAFEEYKDKFKPGDVVVVWWIDALGHHFEACHQAILSLLALDVEVKTISQNLSFKKDDFTTNALLAMLQGFAQSETQKRLSAAELARHKLREHPDKWQKKYRGRPKNKALHQQILSLLLSGETLHSTAQQTQASLSTVKRVKAKITHMKEIGQDPKQLLVACESEA